MPTPQLLRLPKAHSQFSQLDNNPPLRTSTPLSSHAVFIMKTMAILLALPTAVLSTSTHDLHSSLRQLQFGRQPAFPEAQAQGQWGNNAFVPEAFPTSNMGSSVAGTAENTGFASPSWTATGNGLTAEGLPMTNDVAAPEAGDDPAAASAAGDLTTAAEAPATDSSMSDPALDGQPTIMVLLPDFMFGSGSMGDLDANPGVDSTEDKEDGSDESSAISQSPWTALSAVVVISVSTASAML